MPTAILLVAHGSRRQAANDDLTTLAALISNRLPEEIVEVGYLEIAQPSIPDGLRTCAKRGAHTVSILPYFLSPGSHVTEDLTRFRDEFLKEFPQIDCHVCPPIGVDNAVVDLLLRRLHEGRYRDGDF